MKSSLEDLAKIISGEVSLRKKQEAIEKAKAKAIEDEKNLRREKIVKGKVKLEDDPIPSKDPVVQNIKLFEWEAPDRYQFKFNNKAFLIVVVLCLAFILLLAVLGHYLLMVAIIALLFLIYVSGTTKPQTVTHKITARGMDTGNRLYEWFLLRDFYFSKKEKQLFLIVDTKLNVPGALIFLLKEKDMDAIFVLLQEKLLYKDIRKQGKFDKLSLGEYIPLEKI